MTDEFIVFTDTRLNQKVIVSRDMISAIYAVDDSCTIHVRGVNFPINVKERFEDVEKILKPRTVTELVERMP